MSLSWCADPSPARWLVESDVSFDRLIFFGPSGFAAYARLRFMPDPTAPGQAEADVELPHDHRSDIAQARRALHDLRPFTSTPQDCYFCVWEGYSDIALPAAATGSALVTLPHRRYALYRGPLTGIDGWERDFGGGHAVAPPAFVWPADHRWIFASDVDPHWAGIGADPAAVDALVADADLDVVRADPAKTHPLYR